MASKKIVCLGGGSLYFTRAIPDLVLYEELAGSEIVLYDIDDEKVARMAAMGRRLADAGGTGFRVRCTTSLADAVDGADFALSSIGGSGAELAEYVYFSRYHYYDVQIPTKYGIQQVIGDTCGPAGMMMALRTIPPYLEICSEMEKRSPNAILLNHSNPMAPVCRAIHKYSNITTIGICHGVQEGVKFVADLLGVPPTELECLWIGTNHYYWFTRILHKGKDVYEEVMKRTREGSPPEHQELSYRLSKAFGYRIVYTEDSHIIEFHPFLTQVCGGQKGLPYGMAKVAKMMGYDEDMPEPDAAPPSPEVRAKFFMNYDAMLGKVDLPSGKENSITGEGIGALVGALSAGRREVFIVNVPNLGAIPNLPATAEVEVEGVTDFRGVRPLHMGEAPLALKGILEKRFVWHELVADAAVKSDRRLALQACLVDEMAILPEKAEAMLDELLLASRDLLPGFFP